MLANFDRYKRDLESLAERGTRLLLGMILDTKHPQAKDLSKEEKEKALDFRQHYQPWYSEALQCVVQLLPNRKDDFVSYYKPARPRKSVRV
jgi:hypothetical protein